MVWGDKNVKNIYQISQHQSNEKLYTNVFVVMEFFYLKTKEYDLWGIISYLSLGYGIVRVLNYQDVTNWQIKFL